MSPGGSSTGAGLWAPAQLCGRGLPLNLAVCFPVSPGLLPFQDTRGVWQDLSRVLPGALKPLALPVLPRPDLRPGNSYLFPVCDQAEPV